MLHPSWPESEFVSHASLSTRPQLSSYSCMLGSACPREQGRERERERVKMRAEELSLHSQEQQVNVSAHTRHKRSVYFMKDRFKMVLRMNECCE